MSLNFKCEAQNRSKTWKLYEIDLHTSLNSKSGLNEKYQCYTVIKLVVQTL